MNEPVKPDALVGDDWMENTDFRSEVEKTVRELDEQWKPLTDALEASEQLSEDDFAIRINARD